MMLPTLKINEPDGFRAKPGVSIWDLAREFQEALGPECEKSMIRSGVDNAVWLMDVAYFGWRELPQNPLHEAQEGQIAFSNRNRPGVRPPVSVMACEDPVSGDLLVRVDFGDMDLRTNVLCLESLERYPYTEGKEPPILRWPTRRLSQEEWDERHEAWGRVADGPWISFIPEYNGSGPTFFDSEFRGNDEWFTRRDAAVREAVLPFNSRVERTVRDSLWRLYSERYGMDDRDQRIHLGNRMLGGQGMYDLCVEAGELLINDVACMMLNHPPEDYPEPRENVFVLDAMHRWLDKEVGAA